MTAPPDPHAEALRHAIEHTLLSPLASDADVERHCQEALAFRLRGVCVHPIHVARCAARLAGGGPLVVSVAGFPLGANHARTKAFEAGLLARDGADEIDVVADLGALLQHDRVRLLADLTAVVTAAEGRPVKVILETAAFGPEEWSLGCEVAVEAGARFVKTSTGFGAGGASLDAVRALRATAPRDVGVKASGGIRTRDEALAMLEAGADRIGTSASLSILAGHPVG